MQYEEGVLLDGRFLLKEFKGAGAYGEVWLTHDQQTDIDVAVKIYVSMESQGLDDFKKEFQVSFDLNHTNLLHANFLEISKEDQRPYLVMPYCPNGSVLKKAGRMEEKELWKYIRDVASGLAYLHSQNPPIINQDIKPDNILLAKNGDYVITDFGISQQARSTLRKSAMHLNSAGSMAYMGPERFSKEYHAVKASDIWSLGVTIFELAMGDLPFCGMGGSMQKQGAEIPDLSENFSPDLNMLMQSCLAKETWDRPTAEQIADYADKKTKGQNPERTWNLPSDIIDTSKNDKKDIGVIDDSKLIQSSKGNVSEKAKLENHDGDKTIIKEEKKKKNSGAWLSWAVLATIGLLIGAIARLIL